MEALGLSPRIWGAALKQLGLPLRYFLIHHPNKIIHDFWLPLICGVSVSVIFYIAPNKPIIVAEGGLLAEIRSIVSILVAFYFAGLLSMLTLMGMGNVGKSLERPMTGSNPPTILTKRNGEWTRRFIRRREYLAYLFGYMIMLQLVVLAVALLTKLLAPTAVAVFSSSYLEVSRAIFVGALAAAFSHLIICTLIAVRYIADRLYRT